MSTDIDFQELERIRQVRIRYTHYYDTGNVAGVVSMFTDDAIVDAGVYGGAKGRDDIRAYYTDRIAETGRTLHIISNPLIEMTGPDTAKGIWYLQDVMIAGAEPGKPPLTLYGTYSDEYRKVNGEWKMSVFKVDIEWPAPGA